MFKEKCLTQIQYQLIVLADFSYNLNHCSNNNQKPFYIYLPQQDFDEYILTMIKGTYHPTLKYPCICPDCPL